MGNKQRNNKKQMVLILSMLLICSIGSVILSIQTFEDIPTQGTPYSQDTGDSSTINVLYISDNENPRVWQAIILDPQFFVTKIASSEVINIDFTDYNCIVIEDIIFDLTKQTELLTFQANGGSLMIIMGPNLQANSDLLVRLHLIEEENLQNIDAGGIFIENLESRNPIVENIEWNSSPETNNMSVITPNVNTETLLNVEYEAVDNNADLVGGDLSTPGLIINSDNNILFVTIWISDVEYNNQIAQWFYFNYFFYTSILVITGNTSVDSYADWEYSPVPHQRDQIIIGIIEVSIIVIAILSFTLAYKKSKAKPQDEYIAEYAAKMQKIEEKRKKKLEEEELEKERQKQEDWEDIGTHRQLSGFLFGMFGSIILMIPQLVLTGYVFARFIMPYPFIAGMYDFAKQIFLALWVLFDMGTSVALAKFFAQYRIDKPEKAIRYIQIFIWFQILTGCIQTAIVGFLGSFYFPHTHLAAQSWLFILNSFIQFPGWFMVLVFVFQGMQRTDLQLITNVLQVAIFDLLGKYVFIYVFRMIFAGIPQYGDAFGALVGYCLGQWLGEFLTFLVSIKIYKKMGFHLGTLFRVDFGKEEFIEVMQYGYKFVLGAVLVPLVHMIQAWLLSIWIFNYNAEWGYYSQVLMITQVAAIVNLYAQGIMSGISEAHSHDAKKLLELNLVQGFKTSYYVSFFLNITLLVVLPLFIEGVMGPAWAPGVVYIPFMIFRALFEPATWMGDKVFQGTGYTREMSISWVVEQGTRVIGLLIFMNPAVLDWQMMGLLTAWTLSLLFKVAYQWIVIRKKICKFNWYYWKTFGGNLVATLLTAGLTYLIRVLLVAALGVGVISGLLLFVIGILGMLPIFSFFSGLFGAWDENTLKEFDRASAMVDVVGPLARMLYNTAAAGAKVSIMDLHHKFEIDIYNDAIKEAKELTARKKQLVL